MVKVTINANVIQVRGENVDAPGGGGETPDGTYRFQPAVQAAGEVIPVFGTRFYNDEALRFTLAEPITVIGEVATDGLPGLDSADVGKSGTLILYVLLDPKPDGSGGTTFATLKADFENGQAVGGWEPLTLGGNLWKVNISAGEHVLTCQILNGFEEPVGTVIRIGKVTTEFHAESADA